ncbi:nucleotide exchange factor GrpE [Patescibacteria group bacterium]|nr:nucleotide exchange factor GrpE [Patescibacteria group bacterium]
MKNKKIKTLEEKYSLLKVRKQELEVNHKRALADYQNLVKQNVREKQEFTKYANEQLLYEIIPVYDNLKISLEHFKEGGNHSSWLEGVKYVVKQFADALKNMGLEEITTEGKEFNYNTMEALEGDGKKVKKEVKSGYKLNGKVIIPAKVILENI